MHCGKLGTQVRLGNTQIYVTLAVAQDQKNQIHTPPVFDNLLDLLLRFHGTQIESLHNWSCCSELWCVIRWWRKLLDDFSSNTRGRLLPPYDWAVSEVTLDEEDHFLVANKDIIAAHNVQPALYRRLQTGLIFLGAGAR